jgi:sec-independent protein translocase protein TatC
LKRFTGGAKFGLLGTMAAFGAGAGSTWYFRKTVFGWLAAPAGGMLSPHDGLPVYTTLTEMMGSTIRLSFHGGMVAAFPVAVLSIYYLVRPVLNRRQRRTVGLFLPLIFLLFLAGNAFAYYVLLPAGVQYLIAFGEGIAVPVITISSYMKIVVMMVFWLGVIAQIPLGMYLASKIGAVSHEQFKKVNRYVPWIALILGAIITPTMDVINMLLVALPIYLLYRGGLFLSWLASPGNGTIMLRRILALGIFFLRRLVVLLLIGVPVLPVLSLLYALSLLLAFVWNGNLSTETWVSRAFRRLLAGIARMAKLSRRSVDSPSTLERTE